MSHHLLLRAAIAGLASVLAAVPVAVVAKGGVYTATKHGDPTTGVYRDTNYPRADCAQCHVSHGAPNAFVLFAANTNALCYTSGCHNNAGALTIYQGPATYDAGSHATRPNTVWPGADGTVDAAAPAVRVSGDWGKCVNCHDPHGYNMDGTGLIPSLTFSREERLCYVCHDGSPAGKDVKSEFSKSYRHPIATAGRHSAAEGGTASAYGALPTNNRHAECVDCHNPHSAKDGYLTPATSSYRLTGVGRIAVTNGAAGAVPMYTYLAPADTTPPVAEYQLCFKCHSSWTTLPGGARDTAVEFNTNNESFHPVEGSGRNITTAMTNSLNGGTGTPRLTTASTIWCSDCHNNDGLPTTTSTVSSYSGFVPKGPHGSNAGSTDMNMSNKILRASYRVTLTTVNVAYSAANFTLCFVCHSPAPFADTSGNNRTDTNFRFHGFHTANIVNNPAGGTVGNIDTPGNGSAGQGAAVCRECHYAPHSTKLTYHATNRTNPRLVSFAPSISGSGGTGTPTFSLAARTCSLRCHGAAHTAWGY